MNRKLLATAICAVMAGFSAASAHAQEAGTAQGTDQDTTTDQPQEQAQNLDKIVVTGSRIPRTQLETASPVTTITAEEIKSHAIERQLDQPAAHRSRHEHEVRARTEFTANEALTIRTIEPDTST